MGFYCCKTFCKEDYATGPKVSVFGLPKEEKLQKKWIKVIPRKDINPIEFQGKLIYVYALF